MAIQSSCTRDLSLHKETVHDPCQFSSSQDILFHSRGHISTPGQSLDQFSAQLFQLLNANHVGNKEVYLIEDFNIDLLKTLLNFIDITTSCRLLPIVRLPIQLVLPLLHLRSMMT